MNRENEQLEAQLRQVKPAAPSAAFMARLRATRPAPVRVASPRRTNLISFVLPLAAAAALVVALSIYFSMQLDSPESNGLVAKSSEVRPVAQTDLLLGAREVGIYRTPDGRPFRVVQSIGIGSATWEDVKTGERRTRTAPQQQLLRVSMNSI